MTGPGTPTARVICSGSLDDIILLRYFHIYVYPIEAITNFEMDDKSVL